ncbi:hypothetical protein OC834_001917 [Tilletia horrida]|nr:hypothetical protein OC834_001917 [Tilletia horrida]
MAGGTSTEDIVLIILALFISPISVGIKFGCGGQLALNIVLFWLTLGIGSAIHAIIIILQNPGPTKSRKKAKASKARPASPQEAGPPLTQTVPVSVPVAASWPAASPGAATTAPNSPYHGYAHTPAAAPAWTPAPAAPSSAQKVPAHWEITPAPAVDTTNEKSPAYQYQNQYQPQSQAPNPLLS